MKCYDEAKSSMEGVLELVYSDGHVIQHTLVELLLPITESTNVEENVGTFNTAINVIKRKLVHAIKPICFPRAKNEDAMGFIPE